MSAQKQAFIDWIKERQAAVKDFEAKAAGALEQNDAEAYREYMKGKALVLAGLLQNGEPLLASMPEDAASPLRHRLRQFSASASNALRIGSVFYMSALLYPEDHQPGQPNDLEIWISGL